MSLDYIRYQTINGIIINKKKNMKIYSIILYYYL